MPNFDFSMPIRLDKSAILIFIVKFVNNTFRKGWAVLVSLYITLRQLTLPGWSIYLMGVIAVIIYVVYSFLAYRRFTYCVQDDELIVEKGVLYKSKLTLPLDKVQAINFKQNILQQIFKVVGIEVDSAGSVKKEIKLDAVNIKMANEFRDFILERKEETDLSTTADEEYQEFSEAKKQGKNKYLIKLSTTDLMKIGITQNHLRSAAIFLAFVLNIYNQLTQFEIDEQKSLEEISGYVGTDWIGHVGIIVVAVILLSLLVSLVVTIIRNYNLRLLDTGKGIKKEYGLFERHQQSTTVNKIQSISWGDNLLKKIFRLNAMRIYPVSSGEANKKGSISITGCYPEHIKAVIEKIFGPQDESLYTEHKMHRLFILRRFLFSGVVPGLILVIGGFNFFGYGSLVGLLWLPIAYIMAWIYYKKWRMMLTHRQLRIDFGLFAHQHRMIELHKIQSISIIQSPFQRRRDLAAVHMVTAGRNLSINYLPFNLASNLYDYIMFLVEKDAKDWM